MNLQEEINGKLYVLPGGKPWRMMAHELPPLGHGLVVLLEMAEHWHQGAGRGGPSSHGPQERGKGRNSQLGHHRQPVGQDLGKRGTCGYGLGKNVSERKPHIVVDTTGLLLTVVNHAASIQDRDGARPVPAILLGRFPSRQIIWADTAYAGQLVAWAWTTEGWWLQGVRRMPDGQLFGAQPRRWVVERTPVWLSQCRRLSRDFEDLPKTGGTWVPIPLVHLVLKSLKPN